MRAKNLLDTVHHAPQGIFVPFKTSIIIHLLPQDDGNQQMGGVGLDNYLDDRCIGPLGKQGEEKSLMECVASILSPRN